MARRCSCARTTVPSSLVGPELHFLANFAAHEASSLYATYCFAELYRQRAGSTT